MIQTLKSLRSAHADRENGFTLTELMIVVLIIGILAAIAIPVFLNLQTEAAKADVKSAVKNASTLAETARATAGLGELSTAADGTITVDGVSTANKVASTDGLTVTITGDDSTPETADYVITGSSEGADGYAYTFTSRTGAFTDGTTPSAGGPVTDPDADSDHDGITDADEAALGTDPNNPDTDGDGTWDGDELGYGTDPNDSGSVWNPNADDDGDGFSNNDELLYGTDPNDSNSFPSDIDSDGDGWFDADEIAFGSDPYDGNSVP